MEAICNGIKIYYEKSGAGAPVILIHGNGEDHKIFDDFVELINKNHTVYALDSRGHGQSEKAILGYRIMARDVIEFIGALGLDNPILVGFSDGGIVALMVAAELKGKIGGLVALGANLRPSGIKRFWLRLFSLQYLFTKSEYLKLMIKEPDIEKYELNAISCPTLIVAGERDMIREEHTREIAAGIKGAELKIVKGEGHSSYVKNAKKLYSLIGEFIEGIGDKNG